MGGEVVQNPLRDVLRDKVLATSIHTLRVIFASKYLLGSLLLYLYLFLLCLSFCLLFHLHRRSPLSPCFSKQLYRALGSFEVREVAMLRLQGRFVDIHTLKLSLETGIIPDQPVEV